MCGVVITAPLQMLIGVGVAKLGQQFESDAHRWMLYIGATLAVVLVMFILHLVIARRAKNANKPRATVTWLETLRGTPAMRRSPRPRLQNR